MDFGSFAAVPAGMTHAIGVMPMVPKMTRGVMRRSVDYTSSVIAYLEVSYSNPYSTVVGRRATVIEF